MRASAILALLVLSVVSSVAVAQEGKKPLPLEELERLQAMNEAMALLGQMEATSDEVQRKRFVHCLRAFGSTPFCECLNSQLPFLLSFADYIGIITASRDDLNYEGLDADNKGVVDNTYAAREKCVAQAESK